MPIRPATPADVPAVLPMVAAICAMHEQLDPQRYAMLPDVLARYERWLPERARDARSVFLVATEPAGEPAGSERVVGFLVASIERSVPIYRLEEFGFIHDLWVEPERRGLGLGRGLALEAMARFRALGVKQVRLETAAENKPARRVFAACGFRVGTVEMLAGV